MYFVILVILVPHTYLSNSSSFSRFSLPHIPSGLNHGLVQRQRSTWEKVPSKHKKSMEVRRLGPHVIGSLTKKHAQLFRRSFNSIFTCNLSSFLLTLLFSLPSPPHPLTSTPPPSTFPPNLPSFPGSPEFHESLPQHGQV